MAATDDFPHDKPASPATTTAALTAALVALAALLPNKIWTTVVGIAAPFVSQGLVWLVGVWGQEWREERKAQLPTRRAERYLRQMSRQLHQLPAADPRRPQLQQQIAELAERLHQHRLNELELKPPPDAAD